MMGWDGDREDRTFTVKIDTLLGHLKTNRLDHERIVEEAQANFRKACIAKLDRMLADAEAGLEIVMAVGLQVPTSHIGHFDSSIGLLNMIKEAGADTVEITSNEYERFVENNWGWSKQFSVSNGPYSSA